MVAGRLPGIGKKVGAKQVLGEQTRPVGKHGTHHGCYTPTGLWRIPRDTLVPPGQLSVIPNLSVCGSHDPTLLSLPLLF